MCEFASIVLTKDAVHWCGFNSHEEIIRKFGLHADGVGGPNVLRIEIRPPTMDGAGLRTPLADWAYKVDQDILPEWADAERDEARARVALADLVAERVLVDRRRVDAITEGIYYLLGSSHVVARGSSHVVARGSSHVEARGSSHVVARGSSHVVARGSSHVEAWESSHVVAWESSHVVAAYHNATIRAYNPQPECKILGPMAVLIDCTGGQAVCKIGSPS